MNALLHPSPAQMTPLARGALAGGGSMAETQVSIEACSVDMTRSAACKVDQ